MIPVVIGSKRPILLSYFREDELSLTVCFVVGERSESKTFSSPPPPPPPTFIPIEFGEKLVVA